ncbi:hypothetical protein K438DRAFT_2087488 [Mycena galopus ATCC 62051]|nr:hypothetical protein K438DRAFT_2087488 [Mycena galopus ATCC 62051]
MRWQGDAMSSVGCGCRECGDQTRRRPRAAAALTLLTSWDPDVSSTLVFVVAVGDGDGEQNELVDTEMGKLESMCENMKGKKARKESTGKLLERRKGGQVQIHTTAKVARCSASGAMGAGSGRARVEHNMDGAGGAVWPGPQTGGGARFRRGGKDAGVVLDGAIVLDINAPCVVAVGTPDGLAMFVINVPEDEGAAMSGVGRRGRVLVRYLQPAVRGGSSSAAAAPEEQALCDSSAAAAEERALRGSSAAAAEEQAVHNSAAAAPEERALCNSSAAAAEERAVHDSSASAAAAPAAAAAAPAGAAAASCAGTVGPPQSRGHVAVMPPAPISLLEPFMPLCGASCWR